MKHDRWLSIHAWWWRLLPESEENDRDLGQYFGLIEDEPEQLRFSLSFHSSEAAFAYEMMIRNRFPNLIPAPWPRLDGTMMHKFVQHFPMSLPTQPAIQVAAAMSDLEKITDSGFTEYCNWAFNLYNGNGTLARYFVKYFLEPQRRQKGIPNPRPNQHQRYGKFSWRSVELLDIQRFHVRPLNNSESSQLSKDQRHLLGYFS
jgi:hypothetical protein